MSYVASTIPGLEEVLKLDVKEILKVNGVKAAKGKVKFNVKDISKFIKKSQSCNLIYSLIKSFNFKNLEDLLNKVNNIEFKIKKDFVVRCLKNNEDLSSSEIEKRVGEVIFEKGNKVNLESKEVIFVDIVDDKCFIGLLIEKDLCKRYYRLRHNNKSINACLAYSLLRLSKVKKNDLILDPFCKDGVILIEAYNFGLRKLFGFDGNNNNIINADINSRLAKAKVKFSNFRVDEIKTKFKKNEVNKLITIAPYPSKTQNKRLVEKDLDKLFGASQIVKDSLTLITPKPEFASKIARKHDFKEVLNKKIVMGDLNYFILIFEK